MQHRKLSIFIVGSLLILTSILPQCGAAPSNPESYRGTWQVGDISLGFEVHNPLPYLLAYNSTDYVNRTIISRNSDYSSPFINSTATTNAWLAAWDPDGGAHINLTLSNSPTPSYAPFDITLKYLIDAQLQLGGNLDLQTAHWQYTAQGANLFEAGNFIGLAYKVTFTAGHYYTVKIGNLDWAPINYSAGYPYVNLMVFPAPSGDDAVFYSGFSYYEYPTNFLGIPYYLARTGIHPLTTQDYYIVMVQNPSNRWIPQQLLIQDEENIWEEYLAANPWFYFFPQVNPLLFIAFVGGIAAIIVALVIRKIGKSKLKAPKSSGAKGDFLDEL